MKVPVLHRVLQALRSRRLQAEYARRWEEWDDEDDIWDQTVGDGLEDEDWSELSEVKEQ